MPAWLENMTIDEISLVDDPANEEARVLIVKARGGALARLREELESAEQELVEKQRALDPQDAAGAALIKENLMDVQAMQAALSEAETQITDLTKAKEKAEGQVTNLTTQVTTLTANLAAANESIAKAKPALSAEEEDAAFLKSLPEAARARIVKDREELAEIKKSAAQKEEEAAEAAEISKAKAYLKGEAEASQMGKLLNRVRKGKATAEDADLIEGIVKSARAIDDKSPLFKTTGSSGQDAPDGSNPDAFYKAKAAELRKEKPELSEAQAYAKAMELHPEIYDADVSKRRHNISA